MLLEYTLARFSKMETSLANMYNVLKKPAESRSKKDLAKMIKLVQDIPFFKDHKMNEVALLEVFNSMTVLSLAQGSTVMNYGDVGDNFYFILFGTVEIHIPDQNKL